MPDFQKLTLSDDAFEPSRMAPGPALIAPDDLSFVICVENNIIGSQALLFCRSLRRFGGRYKDCAIIAVAPRPALAPRPDLIADLEALLVRTEILPLNQTDSTYGSINRIMVAAWAERALTTSFIAVLDSDTVFVGPPDFPIADVGLRPVDAKGTASTGPADPMDAYWEQVFAQAGVGLDRAPWVFSTTCKTRIRASYNGGFCVARRSLGVFQATEAIFFAGYHAGLTPTPDPTIRIFASTGRTSVEASGWWGSSQAALSAAVSAHARNILIYPETYNIPLHILARQPTAPASPTVSAPPVLIHYHHLSAPAYQSAMVAGLDRVGTGKAVRDWVLDQCAGLDWPLAS